MTEKERYETIIDALTEKIIEQGKQINLKDWQISNLRERLEEAEFKLNANGKGDNTVE